MTDDDNDNFANLIDETMKLPEHFYVLSHADTRISSDVM